MAEQKEPELGPYIVGHQVEEHVSAGPIARGTDGALVGKEPRGFCLGRNPDVVRVGENGVEEHQSLYESTEEGGLPFDCSARQWPSYNGLYCTWYSRPRCSAPGVVACAYPPFMRLRQKVAARC
jgi:hypothetical protein